MFVPDSEQIVPDPSPLKNILNITMFRVRFDVNTDRDPAFEVNTDPASDSVPGILRTKMKEKKF